MTAALESEVLGPSLLVKRNDDRPRGHRFPPYVIGFGDVANRAPADAENAPSYFAFSGSLLEAFRDAVALLDRSGVFLISNRLMQNALDRRELRREIVKFSAELVSEVGSRRDAPMQTMTRQFSNARDTHHLRGTYFGREYAAPHPTFCITLHTISRSLPSEADLQSRFRLTRQQARVALCLAEGRTNDDVAQILGVSSHTARHHTEHVLSKMALGSRSEVAWKLLQD